MLLIAYDTDYPEPMHAKRPVPDAFGAAFVLTPQREPGSLMRIEMALGAGPADQLSEPQLEALRTSIPAARCLPLLRKLARREEGPAVLEYLGVSTAVVLAEPCR